MGGVSSCKYTPDEVSTESTPVMDSAKENMGEWTEQEDKSLWMLFKIHSGDEIDNEGKKFVTDEKKVKYVDWENIARSGSHNAEQCEWRYKFLEKDPPNADGDKEASKDVKGDEEPVVPVKAAAVIAKSKAEEEKTEAAATEEKKDAVPEPAVAVVPIVATEVIPKVAEKVAEAKPDLYSKWFGEFHEDKSKREGNFKKVLRTAGVSRIKANLGGGTTMKFLFEAGTDEGLKSTNQANSKVMDNVVDGLVLENQAHPAFGEIKINFNFTPETFNATQTKKNGDKIFIIRRIEGDCMKMTMKCKEDEVTFHMPKVEN